MPLWTRQPQAPAKVVATIDNAPVIAAVTPWGIEGSTAPVYSSAVRTTNVAGRGWSGNQDSSCLYGAIKRPFVMGTNTDLTFICVLRNRNTASEPDYSYFGLGSSFGSSGNTRLRLAGAVSKDYVEIDAVDSAGNQAYAFYTDAMGGTDLLPHAIVVSMRLQSGGYCYTYVDGRFSSSQSCLLGAGAAATTFDFVSVNDFFRGGSTTGIAATADVMLGVAVLGQLSEARCVSLSANPWQLFAPSPRRIYVDVPAGGGGGTTGPRRLAMMGVG